jgi:hypothetical protein
MDVKGEAAIGSHSTSVILRRGGPWRSFFFERLNATILVHQHATTVDGTFYELTTRARLWPYARVTDLYALPDAS